MKVCLCGSGCKIDDYISLRSVDASFSIQYYMISEWSASNSNDMPIGVRNKINSLLKHIFWRT